ncbi:MAG TPA: ATP-binding protein [Pyrinomonadaceae bacterium]|nr:ATP-binding protein [Pyrinomonadaceae bacterium]
MDKKDFIKRALYKPNDYIAYHVARELAKLYPDKTIVEGATGYFDLEEFARAEKCTIVEEGSIFHHIRTFWKGPRKEPIQEVENSWLNVLWRGQLLEVVLISWAESCYRFRHHWIIADDRKVADTFFAEVCEWSAEVRGEILVFQDGDWEKNRELYDAIKSSTFDNLILHNSLKTEIVNDFSHFFSSKEFYERHGIPWKRGVLFIGPPGNGKTHTLKALVNELKRPCLYVKGFKSEYATEQQNIALVFKRARMAAPCFLVFEDLDAMIDDENRSFFLNELDGFETNGGIAVLATTNYPDKLDPAIVDRPSRFDRKYFFNAPGAAEREAYVSFWNRELQAELRLSTDVSVKVVRDTEGFSFAYLKELFLSSMMQWMGSGRTSMDEGSERTSTDERSGRTSMDELMVAEVARLRRQMPEQGGSDEACH